ncbi:MAG: 2-amino-4-hydroxy-6-hydroxymethyldihydropteridine diphosphokinase [Thermoguttaceae bacterium]|nr:2-amino-4-hydroxy-6-hydroxymethyldihydropteridine diphosphokinase [Thermoguttaceae bacterium]
MNVGEPEEKLAIVAFGANMGDVKGSIKKALFLLGKVERVTVLKVSSVWRTLPVGGPANQPEYFNGAVLIKSNLSPYSLLEELQTIEYKLMRVRRERWGPRTMDLDLVLYGDLVVNTSELTLPHPRAYWRHFVLDPVCEIASELVLPTTGLTFDETRRLLYFIFREFEVASFFCLQQQRFK